MKTIFAMLLTMGFCAQAFAQEKDYCFEGIREQVVSEIKALALLPADFQIQILNKDRIFDIDTVVIYSVETDIVSTGDIASRYIVTAEPDGNACVVVGVEADEISGIAN